MIITEREREREQIQQLRTLIALLEAVPNRTPQQEQELQNKKRELEQLERQSEGSFKKYLPWIIGGGIALILVIGIVVYFLWGSKGKDKS